MQRKLSRREVLAAGAGAAAVAIWHAPLFAEGSLEAKRRSPLMRRIRLETAAPLDAMEEFYCDKMGFARLERSKRELSLQGGVSILSFHAIASASKPVHHFAFNIPQNKIRSAVDWAKKSLNLIPAWGDLEDPSYPKEVIHFRHWNAHSLFFFDPAFNLVEFIARHELRNDVSGAFSEKDILYASELGFPTDDPVATAKFMHQAIGLAPYPGGTPQFAMGDAHGLLLCLRNGQVWGEHAGTPIRWGRHSVEVEIAGKIKKLVEVPGYPYKVRVV